MKIGYSYTIKAVSIGYSDTWSGDVSNAAKVQQAINDSIEDCDSDAQDLDNGDYLGTQLKRIIPQENSVLIVLETRWKE